MLISQEKESLLWYYEEFLIRFIIIRKSIWAPKIMKKVAMASIWMLWSSRTTHMFDILKEVHVEVKCPF